MSSSALLTRKDYGFFGPDSITWKIFSYPTASTIGFQRTAAVEMFEPFVLASVHDSGSIATRPASRYDRTMHYVSTIAFGSSDAAVKAADILMRIHSRIDGTEPISGLPYRPNDPDAQLWIHLTEWHSVLYVYEVFGPGKLSVKEEAQYWAECAIAAEMQTIDPADIPANRAEMRDYYARVRPQLASSVAAQETVDQIFNSAEKLLGELPFILRPLRPLVRVWARKATIATMPHWMRRMAGVQQGRLQDASVIVLSRLLFRVITRSTRLQVRLIRSSAPLAAPVITPVLLREQPDSPTTTTPAAAWAAAGLVTPRERWIALGSMTATSDIQADDKLLAFN